MLLGRWADTWVSAEGWIGPPAWAAGAGNHGRSKPVFLLQVFSIIFYFWLM
jgi:hypothetical protein